MANAHCFLRVDSFGNVCRLIPLPLSLLLLLQPYAAQYLPILNIISYLNLTRVKLNYRIMKIYHIIQNITPSLLGAQGETGSFKHRFQTFFIGTKNSRLRNTTFPIPLTGVRRGIQRSDIACQCLSSPWCEQRQNYALRVGEYGWVWDGLDRGACARARWGHILYCGSRSAHGGQGKIEKRRKQEIS